LSALYLIRHATPDWSRTDISYTLPPGPPLTPQGEQEAAGLGEFLREAGVGQVLHSPMERCRRTAEIAAAVVGLAPQADPGLGEWQPGEAEAVVRARFWPVWERLTTNGHGAGPTALVTHGGPIAMMLAALGLDAQALAHYRKIFDRNNPLPPAGAWRAERTFPGGPWALHLVYMPEAYRKQDFVV